MEDGIGPHGPSRYFRSCNISSTLRRGFADESLPKEAHNNPEPGEAAEVASAGGERSVDGVAFAVSDEVPAHAMILLAMADDGLSGGSHAQFFFGPGLFLGISAFVAAICGMRERVAPVVASIPERTVFSVRLS